MEADWNRTGAPFSITEDDGGTPPEEFGQYSLKTPSGRDAELILLDSIMSATDAYAEMDFLGNSLSTCSKRIGLRINTASSNDGYYAGYNFNGASHQLLIWKRVSGVFSVIGTGSLSLSAYNNRRFKIKFIVVDDDLEVRLINYNGGSPFEEGVKIISDATFSNAGTAAIYISNAASTAGSSHIWIDNFKTNEIA